MTKEQEEAIEMLEDIENNTWTTKYIMSSDSKKAETVLNMLKEKDREIEQKDKIIDLMVEYIDGDDTSLANYLYRKNGKCNKEMIKQYFKEIAERKSEEC